MIGFLFRSAFSSALQKRLRTHFAGVVLAEMVTAARDFPVTSRVDVQAALEGWFRSRSSASPVGVHSQMTHETLTLAHLITPGPFGVDLSPLQHDEVDVGDAIPVRCLITG